jgi:hypothetical protein
MNATGTEVLTPLPPLPLEAAVVTLHAPQAETLQATSVEAALQTPQNPLPVEAVPQTAQDISARLSGLRGLMTKAKDAITVTARGGEPGNEFSHELSVGQSIKARLLGRLTLARTRAAMRGEEYDPAVHNRTVQNNLYRHAVSDERVESHLQTHDPRFNRYAEGKIGRAEVIRRVPGDIVAAMIGVVAIVGIAPIHYAAKAAEAGSPLQLADEANRDLVRTIAARLDQAQERGVANPRRPAHRAGAVWAHVSERKYRQQNALDEAARRKDPRNAAHYRRLEESMRQRVA